MFSRARRPANDPGFVWNVPAEMRFVRVTDDAALNIVPPGMYGVVELIAVGATGARAAENQGWMKKPSTPWRRFSDNWAGSTTMVTMITICKAQAGAQPPKPPPPGGF